MCQFLSTLLITLTLASTSLSGLFIARPAQACVTEGYLTISMDVVNLPAWSTSRAAKKWSGGFQNELGSRLDSAAFVFTDNTTGDSISRSIDFNKPFTRFNLPDGDYSVFAGGLGPWGRRIYEGTTTGEVKARRTTTTTLKLSPVGVVWIEAQVPATQGSWSNLAHVGFKLTSMSGAVDEDLWTVALVENGNLYFRFPLRITSIDGRVLDPTASFIFSITDENGYVFGNEVDVDFFQFIDMEVVNLALANG